MWWIMDSLILELSSVCNELCLRYSHTLNFRKLSWNIDAFYYTTSISQSSLFAMWNGNPIKSGEEFLQSPNKSSARWRCFITTTQTTIRNLQGFAFLCKLELLLFKPRWDYKIYTNEKNRMTSLCKWAITCTSKDKHGDLSKFLFSQA